MLLTSFTAHTSVERGSPIKRGKGKATITELTHPIHKLGCSSGRANQMQFGYYTVKIQIAYLAAVLSSAALQAENVETIPPQLPSVDTTMILIGTNQWSLRELNQLALNHLINSGNMPKGTKVSVVLNITPKDDKMMCEFDYHQGLGADFWQVGIGYDGKVKHAIKSRLEEGKPKQKTP